MVGALHGNEPAGVHAARTVVERLHAEATPLRGDLLALVGNLGGLRDGVRHHGRDLNRLWTRERLADLARGELPTPWDEEDVEQVELFQAIGHARRRARGPVFLLDLHTTSGGGAPFSIAAGTPESLAFARTLPVTCLTRLIERLGGTMAAALAQEGVASVVLECGQSEDPRAVEHAAAAIRLALVAAGLLDGWQVSGLDADTRLLAAARDGLPRAIEVVYRHAITPSDGFRMEPGFRHFRRVAKGEVVARDARGPVASPADGYILMPLYQPLGDDGFFVGRETGA